MKTVVAVVGSQQQLSKVAYGVAVHHQRGIIVSMAQRWSWKGPRGGRLLMHQALLNSSEGHDTKRAIA